MSDLFEQISNAMADTVEAAGSGIVRVEGRRRMAASGIAWQENIVVTAHHVLRKDEGIRVGLPGGEIVNAELVGRDPNSDLAVLRVEAALSPVRKAEASSLRVGHLVLAVARPGNSVQATHGVVSAIGSGRTEGIIQTDVVMYPGFSGGPLVDASGKVQGMNTSGFNRGASMTVSVSVIEQVVSTLLEHGKMKQGFLGVGAQPARLPEAVAKEVEQETGLLLVAVEPGSPADQGGLLLGDVIIALDDEATPHMDALLSLLSASRVGQSVPVKLLRGGQLQTLSVTIGEKA